MDELQRVCEEQSLAAIRRCKVPLVDEPDQDSNAASAVDTTGSVDGRAQAAVALHAGLPSAPAAMASAGSLNSASRQASKGSGRHAVTFAHALTFSARLCACAMPAARVRTTGTMRLATSSTSYSTSALGTIATASGADAYKAGLGTGVGKALDRLAQYYIKLAENTFPVIEVDAGREIDVVITKGVRIDVPMAATAERNTRTDAAPTERYLEASDDGNY